MDKLEIAKKIIEDNFKDGDCGLYDCRNIVGDYMITLYDKYGLTIDICYVWSYFEVFGLTDEEFDQLKTFYRSLEENRLKKL